MEKQRLIKVLAVITVLVVASFGTLTTWGLLVSVQESQLQIIAQQNHLIDLQEKIIENINTVFVPTSSESEEGLPLQVEVHLEMWHYDNDGNLKAYSRHAGVLTTTGKNWIEGVLGDADGDQGDYIGLSNSTSSPSSAWTELPEEITTGGMSRALGTYADDGDGAWNITKSFSPTESNSTRLVGLYSTAATASLIASDTITAINYENGDTVEIKWTISVS